LASQEQAVMDVELEEAAGQLLPTRIIGTVSVRAGPVPVTGRGGPYGCETSRLPHLLDQWFQPGVRVPPGVREDILGGT
jgi:hypothetical protein